MTRRMAAVPVLVVSMASLAFLAGSQVAAAKGCLKGAAVGAVAGHVAGHHAVLGAVAGCAVGHHLAKKKREQQREQQLQLRQPQSPGPAQPHSLPDSGAITS
jgi:uncharacterized protein YcfJ